MSKLFKNYQKNQTNKTLLNPKLKDIEISPNQQSFIKSPNILYDSDWIIPNLSLYKSQEIQIVQATTPILNQKVHFSLHYYISQNFNISEKYIPFIKSSIMVNKVPNIEIDNFSILTKNSYQTDWYQVYGDTILIKEGYNSDVEYTELEPGHIIHINPLGYINYMNSYYEWWETPLYNNLNIKKNITPYPLPSIVDNYIYQNHSNTLIPSSNELWTKKTNNLYEYTCWGNVGFAGIANQEYLPGRYTTTINETYTLTWNPTYSYYYFKRDAINRPTKYMPLYTPDVTNIKIRLLIMFNNPKLNLTDLNYNIK